MDMLLPGTDPPAPVPGVAREPGRRVSGFIQAGGRAVILVEASAPARAAALDGILASLPVEAIRIGNPLASALTLHRLLFQLGIEDESGDPGGLIVCALDLPSGAGMAVLAVDDAHSLTPEAVAALARVPSPATADQAGRLLLLAGGPGLLSLLSAPGCEALRDPRLALTVVTPSPAGPVAAVLFEEPDAADVPPTGAGTGRRWWIGSLLAGSFLVGLIGTPVLFWANQASVRSVPVPSSPVPSPPAPSLPGAQPAHPAPPGAMPPQPEVIEAPGALPVPDAASDTPERSTTAPQPTLAQADARLRREFDAFLDRAGRDTAGLNTKAREGLFRDYLNWRIRNAGRPEARRQGAP